MLLVIMIVGALLSMSVGAVANRSQRDGMMFWAAGLAMHTASYVLLNQREQIGEFAAISLAIVLRSCSWATCAEGLYEFYRRAPPRRLIWAPVALIFLSLVFLSDKLTPRTAIISLIFAAQCFLALSLIWKNLRVTPGRGKYFLVTGLSMAISLLLLRAVGAARGASTAMVSLTEPSQIQTISLVGALMALTLLSFGFVLMSKDRADNQNLILATQDELTGLANRRRLNEVLAIEWARAQRSGQSLALAMIDIDEFKLYNDHYGHQAGDECLRRIAQGIGLNARRIGDLAARYGGEEFLLILPDADAAVAQRLAETVRKSIASLDLPHVHSPTGRVTVSIGVAAMSDTCHKDAEGLLRAADEALYRAKDGGRNQVRVAFESLPQDTLAGGPQVKLVQLIWRRGYESGNAVIDAQHQNLFSDANNLLSAVLGGRQTQEVAALVDGFIADIALHFQEEEAITETAGFPGAAEHADLHRALLEKAFALAQRFRAGTLSLGELFEYLAHEVVARHILGADREFFQYLAPRG